MQSITITRSLRTLAAVGALAAVSVAVAHQAGAAGHRTPTVPVAQLSMLDRSGDGLPVPATLEPPAGNVLSANFDAEGVQIYKCTKTDTTPLAWTFVEPAATLKGKTVKGHKHVTAIHFRGPSWQSPTDGSLVEGKAIANSPVTGSIPQLLVQATRTQGTGIFGTTTYVQRLATTGGAAPTGTCTEGAVAAVPYTAVYRFFVAG